MPRNHANNNSRKSTPSGSSKKAKRKQANSDRNSDQRISDGETIGDEVDLSLTPTFSAAHAVGTPLQASTTSMSDSKPIAKLQADTDGKSNVPPTSQEGTSPPIPTTPTPTTNLPAVTFEPTQASIAASRRKRSRRTGVARTSRSLSRDEQLMMRWEDEQYHVIFDSSRPGADPTARTNITLASGQRVKAGESLSPDFVDIYLSQLREDPNPRPAREDTSPSPYQVTPITPSAP